MSEKKYQVDYRPIPYKGKSKSVNVYANSHSEAYRKALLLYNYNIIVLSTELLELKEPTWPNDTSS